MLKTESFFNKKWSKLVDKVTISSILDRKTLYPLKKWWELHYSSGKTLYDIFPLKTSSTFTEGLRRQNVPFLQLFSHFVRVSNYILLGCIGVCRIRVTTCKSV